ncbi:MAG: molybdopterin-dependent oxidoreductase [Vicinamibacterales bacterium]|jgi:anaerobic selenocysteine-containing dehydrogenase|nr:molybdopterin-dependent oxidoreductase [Vicinamibacterales bacterium]
MPALRTIRTVCPRNCYCTCGMLVTLDEANRIVSIDGDPENPATGGHVCLKGLAYARRVTYADRLLTPLRRRASGAGFEPVGWDDALGEITQRLSRVRTEHGPEAALYYEGSGSHGALGGLAMAFWRQFGGCTTTFGDLCWPAGLEATRLTYGDNRHNHPSLTVQGRMILLWGHNPAETNIHQWRLILDAQAQGARVVVIDPRQTDSTDGADVHLQPRPGTDAALALGMASVIVEDGLHDSEFLDAHAHGFDEYRQRLASFPLERVASITGLEPEAIRGLARDYARTKPALLIAGFGLQRHSRAGQTMRTVALLPALTGNVGLAGGGWQYANLASHCLRPLRLPPEPAAARSIPVSQVARHLETLDRPPIRAAWVERGNPASQNPASHRLREALARLDLVVVVDQFMTPTAELAHFVLPAKTLFEEEDLVTAYWHPYLQWRAKILSPPGDVRPETEIWRAMCERFGYDTSYFPGDREAFLRALLPEGCAATLEDVKARPIDLSENGDVAFADHRFPTPSGKVEFASDEAAAVWGVDRVPAYAPAAEGAESPARGRFPLQLLSCKTRDRIHSQFGNLDWVRGVERPHLLDIHPDDARARGIADGSNATVWNDRGRIELVVRVTPGIRPGVVHVLEGWCHDGDPDVNALTAEGITDMNHGATFYECLVEVARA